MLYGTSIVGISSDILYRLSRLLLDLSSPAAAWQTRAHGFSEFQALFLNPTFPAGIILVVILRCCQGRPPDEEVRRLIQDMVVPRLSPLEKTRMPCEIFFALISVALEHRASLGSGPANTHHTETKKKQCRTSDLMCMLLSP